MAVPSWRRTKHHGAVTHGGSDMRPRRSVHTSAVPAAARSSSTSGWNQLRCRNSTASRRSVGQRSSTASRRSTSTAKVRRELEEGGPELQSERLDPVEEPFDGFRRVAQAPDVGEVAADLDDEAEALGRFRCPALDGAAGREPVEGAVHLHRGESRGVGRQPSSSRRPAVEVVPPAPVLPAGSSDPNHGAPLPACRRPHPGSGPWCTTS